MDREQLDALSPIIEPCVNSTEMVGRVFFPHYLTRPFSPEHQKIFKLLDSKHKKVAIAAPRGFGKTTIDGLFFPARETLFQQIKYGVFISATQSKAIEDLTTLKRELTMNKRVTQVFGDLKPGSRDIPWASMMFETSTGVKWVAKGADQQFRGLKFLEQRPDLVIIDDFEDPEEVDNDELRLKRKRRFYADILHSIDIKKTRVVLLGTVLHEDSLLSELLEDPLWESAKIRLANERWESNWPEFMTTEEIRADMESYKQKGMLDIWLRERCNECITEETASFKPSMMKYYNEAEAIEKIRAREWETESCVLVDPARTVQPDADFSAIVGVTLDFTNRRILVRDVVMDRMHPDDLYQRSVEMARRLRTPNIGIEDHGLHEHIQYPFEAYLRSVPGYFNVTWLKPKGKAKEDRIKGLIPFYRMGIIWHNDQKEIHGPLEAQLFPFPHGKYKDAADALAYLNQMFDVAEIFLGMEPVKIEKKDPLGNVQTMNMDELPIEELARMDRKSEGIIDGWQWI